MLSDNPVLDRPAMVSHRERPILFSAPMVRAILDGRKTQTRRAVKTSFDIIALSSNEAFRARSPYPLAPDTGGLHHYVRTSSSGAQVIGLPCPYGRPGDRLWVRESAWYDKARVDDLPGIRCFFEGDEVRRSDGHHGRSPWPSIAELFTLNKSLVKRPGIHMPRWASRLTLEIADVRMERLHDISAKDIIAEGAVDRPHVDQFGRNPVSAFDGCVYLDLKSLWAAGWEKINGKGSWAPNPWVWALTFRRVD